jgi:hypothetical protein
MYATFAQVDPRADLGTDFSAEYAMAKNGCQALSLVGWKRCKTFGFCPPWTFAAFLAPSGALFLLISKICLRDADL